MDKVVIICSDILTILLADNPVSGFTPSEKTVGASGSPFSTAKSGFGRTGGSLFNQQMKGLGAQSKGLTFGNQSSPSFGQQNGAGTRAAGGGFGTTGAAGIFGTAKQTTRFGSAPLHSNTVNWRDNLKLYDPVDFTTHPDLESEEGIIGKQKLWLPAYVIGIDKTHGSVALRYESSRGVVCEVKNLNLYGESICEKGTHYHSWKSVSNFLTSHVSPGCRSISSEVPHYERPIISSTPLSDLLPSLISSLSCSLDSQQIRLFRNLTTTNIILGTLLKLALVPENKVPLMTMNGGITPSLISLLSTQ